MAKRQLASVPDDTLSESVSLPIVKLWMLRIMVPLGGRKESSPLYRHWQIGRRMAMVR